MMAGIKAIPAISRQIRRTWGNYSTYALSLIALAYLACFTPIHWAFFLSAVASQTKETPEIVAFSPTL